MRNSVSENHFPVHFKQCVIGVWHDDLSTRRTIICAVRLRRIIFLLWRIFSALLNTVQCAICRLSKGLFDLRIFLCLTGHRHAGGGIYQLRVVFKQVKSISNWMSISNGETQWIDEAHATSVLCAGPLKRVCRLQYWACWHAGIWREGTACGRRWSGKEKPG